MAPVVTIFSPVQGEVLNGDERLNESVANGPVGQIFYNFDGGNSVGLPVDQANNEFGQAINFIGLNDGLPLSSGQVGISTVYPDLVRDMLPPGVLQHTFDITVQAPGISVFSTPVPMTSPNIFGLPPGTQQNFLSFDHTTGRLVIEGTGTVSADGLFVTTDPGTGITHPGWHGWTPPGGCGGSGGSGGPPPPPPPPDLFYLPP